MNPEEARSWDVAVNGHTTHVSALALILWDFILTFDDERELFWKKKFTFATVLFIWSRYVGLIVTIFGAFIATSHNVSSPLCMYPHAFLT